jgi:para-nitrobenzyl esterase
MRGFAMMRRIPAPACLFAALVLLPATPAAAGQPGPTTGSTAGSVAAPVARTETGAVRGVRAGRVESFLGIPYAAPPVGALRWQPPRPAARWAGVRAADQFGNRCPALASTNGPRSETEDCLFVNVQRPAGAHQGERLPVYVFIHGGGLTNGSSNQMNMDKIVRETGVIGVSINYRLGVFGFLRHPALTAAAGESGNFGFLDQQAALRWVRRNIAAFGGSPGRVTIGGESAGGFSVCAHLVAPGSRGLFAQAMIQSGACTTTAPDQADAAGTAFATAAGCPDPATAARCLGAASTGALLDASTGFSAAIVRGTPTLPADPRAAVRAGQFARVPLVIGANRDEGRTFTQGLIGATQQQYTDFVRASFGAAAQAVLARYPWPATADQFTAAYLSAAALTDQGFGALGLGGCSGRGLIQDLARYTPTFAYEFDHRTGPGLADRGGYVWGAGHAAELAYLFPSFDNGTPIAPLFDAGERRLARDMVRYWGAFVATGQPRAAGQARWPGYRAGASMLSLRAAGHSAAISDAAYTAEHQCAFWDALPPPA